MSETGTSKPRLAAGRLGVVYRARGFDDPDKLAAVKVFTETRDSAAIERMRSNCFRSSASNTSTSSETFDHGLYAGLAFIATEFVTGTDCARHYSKAAGVRGAKF